MERKEKGFLSRLFAVGVGSALSKLCVLFLLPLYTSRLSPAEFGRTDILINTAALLLPLFSLQAPEALFRFIAGGEDERSARRAGRVMLCFGAGAFFLILPALRLFEVLRGDLPLLACYVAAAVLHSYFAHLLRARGQYTLYAVQQLFCTLFLVALAFLLLATLDLGVTGYLLAILLSDALTAFILWGYCRARPQSSEGEERPLLAPMLRYALPLVPGSLLWWAVAVLDRYVVLHYYGQAEAGLYAAAAKLPSLLSFASMLFLEVWHYVALHERKEDRAALFDRVYAMILPTALGFCLCLMIGARFLVGRIFAQDFAEAWRYVPILSVASLFSALSSFLGSVNVIKLRSFSSLLAAVVGALSGFLFDILLIPRFGLAGAAFATLIAHLTVFVYRAVDAKRVMPFCMRGKKLLLSFAFLLLTAFFVLEETLLLAALPAACTVLPFFQEMRGAARIFLQYLKKMFRKSTKNTKIT